MTATAVTLGTAATLRTFFFDQDSDSGVAVNLPALRDAVEAVLGNAGPGIAGPSAAKVVAGKLAEALDVSLADILAEAWNSHQEIQRAARDSLSRPGETVYVPLAAHRLTSSRLPSVEVVANGKPVHRLVFDLRLSLKLEGAVLELRDGRIRKVSAGNCQGDDCDESDDSA
jgi:hypothetical protein